MSDSPRLWGKGSCDVYTPFKVVLPLPNFDFEFGYHNLIQEIQKGATGLELVDQIANEVFHHPLLDLASILERKRGYHQGPSPEDTNILQDYIQECTNDILGIHEKITGLIGQIVSLCNDLTLATAQLAQKSGQRALCRNVLSPVKHLNLDVLEAIFLACWNDRGTGIIPSSLKPPLQLASVCYRWRDVVYSMPKLWSVVYVHHQPLKLDSSLSLASAWLKRARSDVSLSLNLPSALPTSTDHAPLTKFLATLSESSVQFSRVELELDDDTKSEEIMDLIFKQHCDNLEELKIRHDEPPDEIPVPGIKKIFLLRIPREWTSAPPMQKDLTLLRLVGEVRWNVLEWILHHCPLLEKVLVSVSSSGWNMNTSVDMPSSTTPILQPHLAYLGISNDSEITSLPSIPTDFLSNFHFPSLRTFEYYVHLEQPAAFPWLTSLPFLPQLHRVALQIQFNAPREAMTDFFSKAQSLEELSVLAPSAEAHMLRLLIEDVKSNPSFLPQLKRLHVSSTAHISTVMSTYRELAEAWSPSLTPVEADLASASRCQLSHLTFHHWHREEGETDQEDETQMRVDLRKSIWDYGKIPDENVEQPEPEGEMLPVPDVSPFNPLQVSFTRHILNEWLYNVPILFEMFPLSFHEMRKYEVLGPDGKWETKTGPMYQSVESGVRDSHMR